jgi:hypothetical protein
LRQVEVDGRPVANRSSDPGPEQSECDSADCCSSETEADVLVAITLLTDPAAEIGEAHSGESAQDPSDGGPNDQSSARAPAPIRDLNPL